MSYFPTSDGAGLNGASPDDGDLLYRLQHRHPGAFEEFLDLYQQPIHRFIYRLLDDPTEAPDVAQEVFIKVFLKIGDFRGDSSLKTWVYRIAVHEASNRRRWFARHRKCETCTLQDDDSEIRLGRYLEDDADSPFDATYRQEQRDLVEESLPACGRIPCFQAARSSGVASGAP
ncbi:MAG: sigma-70 family RNA polymerase sigma factor, partial [Acidobacteria bacterium]|nr:sigma-70 family RNA polymerase sigma factor [Acidobacteriota bacterium]